MLDWEIGGLLALEDAIDIVGRAPVLVNFIRSIGDQTATRGPIASGVDRRQLVFSRERNDQLPATESRRAGRYDQAAARLACELSDGLLYPASVASINRRQLHPECRCHRLDRGELGSSGSYGRITNDHRSCQSGRNLLKQF